MHSNEADYTCPTCHWTIKVGIPHECNFNICHECNGKGAIGWRKRETCVRCNGTGKWTNKPEEDNPKGALVHALL